MSRVNTPELNDKKEKKNNQDEITQKTQRFY